MQVWDAFKDWFLSLGENYGVNPYIFGGIYIGAVPFFFFCLSWTIKNIRNKKPFTVPLLLTGFFFISAYLYLLIVGKNIPLWVYIFIGVLILYSGYTTFMKLRKARSGSS